MVEIFTLIVGFVFGYLVASNITKEFYQAQIEELEIELSEFERKRSRP